MGKRRVKYWAGYHASQNMDNPSYAESWKKAAISAEAENMELIVFRLPKNSGAIKAVEDFLQEKFSESGTKIEE